MKMQEQNYDFLERRREIHRPDRRDGTLSPRPDETVIDESWTLAVSHPGEPLLLRAVCDLQDYLFVSMKLSLKIAVPGKALPSSKVLMLELEQPPESSVTEHGVFTIDVTADYIKVSSSEARAVWFGSLRLEDLMNLREAPFLQHGRVASRPYIDIREIHSGCGMDDFPDYELNAIAHAGFNTIRLFVKGFDVTTQGYCNINDLIRRAAGYGLDVAFYSYLPSFKHPDELDTEAFFDSIYGELFRRYPGAKGISLVGESLEFPSRDPATTGKRWKDSVVDGIPDPRPSPGWWPCEDYPAYLHCIEQAVHRVKPDAEITFSTYNWGYVDVETRTKFLEQIKSFGIKIKVPFELFTRKKLRGLSCPVMDYTISETEGSDYFKTECASAHRLGIDLLVTSNTAGATWDFGTVPYVPTPYKWIARINTLMRANAKWNVRSFYETHHYGWEPNVVIELAKFSFRSPRETDLEMLLEKLAIRDYGREAAPSILKTWRHWSDAMDHYVASNEDQYGPWRVGPAYPFIFHPDITRTMSPKEIPFPASEHAYFGGDIVKTFYHPYENAAQSPGSMRFPAEIAELEEMLKLWNRGLDCLDSALDTIPAKKHPDGQRLAALGRFIRNSIITTLHIKQWWQLNVALLGTAERAPALKLLDELEKIAAAEIANAEATIPAVECDSRLGWEPSMGYVADKWHLEWKTRQVNSALTEINLYRKMLNL